MMIFHSNFFKESLSDLNGIEKISLDFSNLIKSEKINYNQFDKSFLWLNNLYFSINESRMLTEIELRVGGTIAKHEGLVRKLIMSVATPVLRKLTLDLSIHWNNYKLIWSDDNKRSSYLIYTMLIKNLYSTCKITLMKLFLNFDGRVLYEYSENAKLDILADFPNLNQLVLLGPKSRLL